MIWREPTHWPTHPPNHPPIHLSKGGSVSTNHKFSNRIELSRLDQILLKFLWFHIFRPTNPPIHPPTHQKKHSPMGGEFFTDSKSSNGIKLSWFVQFLLNFYWFGGAPLGDGWVGGWVGVGVGVGNPHTHAHARTRARVWHHREFPMGYPNGSSHLHEIIMSICIHVRARACVRAHARVRVCGGCPHPPTHPPRPPPTHPPPRGVTPKTVKFQYVLI